MTRLVEFHCTACGARLQHFDTHRGLSVPCPRCQARNRVPRATAEEPVADADGPGSNPAGHETSPSGASGGQVATVRTFLNLADLDRARMLLEAEGIEVFTSDEHTIQMDWFYAVPLGGLKLQVREEDWERARTRLGQHLPESEPVMHPARGSKTREIVICTTIVAGFIFAVLTLYGQPAGESAVFALLGVLLCFLYAVLPFHSGSPQ